MPEESLQYPLNSRLGGFRSWSGCFLGEDLDLLPVLLSSHMYDRSIKAAGNVNLRVNPR
jgi:hypothetical protein